MKDGKKNVILLGTSSLLNDISSEIIKPLLPLMILSLGGGSILVGLLNGLRNFISFAFRIFFGYLSDFTKKRKVWVTSGYGISAVFKFLLSIASTPLEVVGFGSTERLGKAIRTSPREALIAESMPKKRGLGYGIDLLMDRSGAIIGTIAVAVLVETQILKIKGIILIASIIALTALIPLIWVKETKFKRLKKSFVLSLKTLSKNVKRFLWVIGLFSIGNIGLFFTILKAKEISHSNSISIVLYALFNIIFAIFVIPFGRLGDKRRKLSIVIGLSLFAFSSILFAFSNDISSLLISFIVLGFAYAMSMGNMKAYITEISKPNEKATALGIAETLQGIISLPTALIAGFLWNISSAVSFTYSAVALFVSTIVFLTMNNSF